MDEEHSLRSRSRRSKVCGWTRGIIGCLIALGIIVVFYFIATTIIDGSSSLDFLLTDEQDPPLKNLEYEIIKNKTFVENDFRNIDVKNEVLEKGTKETTVNFTEEPDLEGRSYIAYIPVPLDEDEESEDYDEDEEYEEDKQGINSMKKRRRKNHREESKNEENSNKPLLVPVMIMNNHKTEQESSQMSRKVLKNRFGRPSQSGRPMVRPSTITSRTQMVRNHQMSPRRLGYPGVRRPPPRNVYRDHDYTPRRSNYQKEIRKRKVSSRRPPVPRFRERQSSSRPSLARYRPERPLMKYSGRTFESEVKPRSGTRSLRNREHTKERRRDSSGRNRKLFRNYDPDDITSPLESRSRRRYINSDRHRPPDTFRYPPSAGSIQDIISYLNTNEKKERRKEVPQRETYRPPYRPRRKPSYETDHFSDENYRLTTPDKSYEDGRYVTHNGDSKRYPTSDVHFTPKFKKHPDTYVIDGFAGDDSEELYYDDDEDSYQEDDYKFRVKNKIPANIRVLPPVRNEHYDQYEPTRGSTSVQDYSNVRSYNSPTSSRGSAEGPMKIIIDVYPDIEAGSSTDPLKTLMYLSEKLLNYNDKRSPFDETATYRSDEEEEEIILHLNLYSSPKKNSYSFSRSPGDDYDGVSIDIPLTGKLTSKDVYEAIVSKARSTPVAAARTGLAGDKSSNLKDNFEIELFDVEEGRKLFQAIEKGLRDINPHLPKSKKIIFSDKEVTKEDLYSLGRKAVGAEVETTSTVKIEATSTLPPAEGKTSSTEVVERMPTPC